ncbi:MAG TPA: hypothetical protein VJ914_05075 [Pseudonocardiaceae bacterium]|nr:hypothetical protein [Pseudonocardiaceae bacterium]
MLDIGLTRPGRGRAVGLIGVGAAIVLALSACSSSQPPNSAPTASAGSSPPGMSCAWPTQLDPQADNSLVPDAVSVDSTEGVWIQPIVASANTRIVLSGHFPDARYASFSVYTPSGGPVTSQGFDGSLDDYQIAPQPGSVNPWQRTAPPGGGFTLVIRSDAAPGQANTLPMPPGTTNQRPGYVLYRVYAPGRGGLSAVPLPALTVQQATTAHPLPPCRQHHTELPMMEGTSGAAGRSSGTPTTSPRPITPPQLAFYTLPRSVLSSRGSANADTAYAVAWLVRPRADKVVVVTGKAPTFVPGNDPSPWPAPGTDVRYWSMCLLAGTARTPAVANALPGGGIDYGCSADEATTLDSAGNYTYVIGSEAQRAAISGVPGVTFLPFATTQSTPLYVLMLRNMLVSTTFAHSPRDVTQANDPGAVAAVMGPYYPHAVVCPLTTLTAGGPQACQH